VNGICVDIFGGYYCDCDEGFTGENCSMIGKYNKVWCQSAIVKHEKY